MSTTSTNYGFFKPEITDNVSVAIPGITGAIEAIDGKIKTNENNITNLAGTGRTTETVKGNADNITNIGSISSISASSNVYTLDVANKIIKNFKIETIADQTQIETATVVGTISTAGNAKVIVTAAGLTGSPKTYSVAVALSDTASQVAGKIITALQADSNLTALYTVGGTGATITLTRVSAQNTDTTLNISIDNDTCAGLISAPTSVDTQSGIANKSITITNIPSGFIRLYIKLVYTNATTITFPAGTVWKDNTSPTFTTGKTYFVYLITDNGGTNWYAKYDGAW